MSCFGVSPSESKRKDFFIRSPLSHREESDVEETETELTSASIKHNAMQQRDTLNLVRAKAVIISTSWSPQVSSMRVLLHPTHCLKLHDSEKTDFTHI